MRTMHVQPAMRTFKQTKKEKRKLQETDQKEDPKKWIDCISVVMLILNLQIGHLL